MAKPYDWPRLDPLIQQCLAQGLSPEETASSLRLNKSAVVAHLEMPVSRDAPAVVHEDVSRDEDITIAPAVSRDNNQSDAPVSRDTGAASRQQRWREKLKEQGYEQKNVVLSPDWITRHQLPGESLMQLVLRACDALDHLVSVSRDTQHKNTVSRDIVASVETPVSRDTSRKRRTSVSRDDLFPDEPVSRDTRLDDAARVQLIARIKSMKDAEGKSYQKIANELNADGVPTMSGRGTWRAGNVERYYKGKKD